MSDVDRCGENNEVIAGRWSEIRWFQCGYVNLPTARSQTISKGPVLAHAYVWGLIFPPV